jgi:hypothetical protein
MPSGASPAGCGARWGSKVAWKDATRRAPTWSEASVLRPIADCRSVTLFVCISRSGLPSLGEFGADEVGVSAGFGHAVQGQAGAAGRPRHFGDLSVRQDDGDAPQGCVL